MIRYNPKDWIGLIFHGYSRSEFPRKMKIIFKKT